MTEGNLEGIEFIDGLEQQYFARAKLGEDAIQFLHSPVGRYLHGCAKQAVEEYRDELEKCNPGSRFGQRKILRLQQKCEQARLFMQWCAESIQDGEAAYKELENYRSE